ncbi:hypothetical protein ACFCW6_03935 [Streptomyces sp. NPDC056333]|uniref:hypothetical protein n=1 Tax=Streptomyces sp. NPDC056333 TaxID=3345786 RepID=UPI0035E02B95
MAELPAIADADGATAHRHVDDFVLRRHPAALATARQDTVTAAVAPPAEMFADVGGMVQLSREQARGRAGGFEIIDYILRGQPGGVPGTWGHHFDDCLLHAPLTDQHRNKIAHQAALIESALGSDPADVPSTAPARANRPPHSADRVRRCRRPAPSRPGPPAPRRPPGPQRRRPHRPPVRSHTPAARDPRTDRRGPWQRPAHRRPSGRRPRPFDLVLAGGLFDYLEERFTRALIRTTLSRLCRPGDTFYFSNIATPNPSTPL